MVFDFDMRFMILLLILSLLLFLGFSYFYPESFKKVSMYSWVKSLEKRIEALEHK